MEIRLFTGSSTLELRRLAAGCDFEEIMLMATLVADRLTKVVPESPSNI